MSLINRVLNELEQRGAHTAPDQTLIRAVPQRRDNRPSVVAVAAIILVAAGVLAAWMLFGRQAQRAETPASGSITLPQLQPALPTTTALGVIAPPASKLSYELSMPPLPDALRAPREPVTQEKPLVAGMGGDAGAETAVVKVEVRPPTRSASVPPVKKISPQQRADADYRKGLQARQSGQTPEALAAFESALKLDKTHEQARMALAALLLDNGQRPAAEQVLQNGLLLKPPQLALAMALARIQIEGDDLPLAVQTLQNHLAQADANAEYQAFYAALLQRQQRHKEAVNHYQLALRLQPRNGVWYMGYAISLQALERKEDAQLAYRQALATQTLTPELSAFVQQKLQELNQGSSAK